MAEGSWGEWAWALGLALVLGGCAGAGVKKAGDPAGVAAKGRAAKAGAATAAGGDGRDDSTDAQGDETDAELDQAETDYADAEKRFKAGDADGGRTALKKAFGEVADQMEEESLPASLHADFSSMVDKIRNWDGPPAAGEDASGLDVALATAAVSASEIKIDAGNPIAQKLVQIYTRRRGNTVEAALARSGRYKGMILSALKARGLPPELFYLVMAESEYKYDAVSRSGAAGLWQFMPGTARKYGLEVSYWVDERFDPEKSTLAAAHYLSDLYQWFGDWDLALAAYNRGEGGLGRDLRYSRSTDFDSLSDRHALPTETHFYVPKFMACALIGTHPEKYGLHPKYEPPEPYDTVALPRDLDLGVAARCAGTSEAEMRRLNPELRAWCTPKDRPGFLLRVPKGTAAAFGAALAKVSDWNPGPTLVRYRVRRGDILGRIARRHRTTVRSIMELNKIRKARVIRPGMVLLIRPGRPGSHARRRRRRR